MRRGTGKKYFIQEHLHRTGVRHGGVGNIDIEQVLAGEGYQPLFFPHFDSFTPRAKAARVFFLLRCLFSIPPDSVIIFQMPLYARLHLIFIRLCLRLRRSIRLVCILSDINGLKDNDAGKLKKEVKMFAGLKEFVVHNDTMKSWLLGINPGARTGSIDFFDFLVQPLVSQRKLGPSIAFAGALDKSRFVWDLKKIQEVDFHLYGETAEPPVEGANLRYYGVFSPDEMPVRLTGSFGLVWDGDSIAGLQGIFGTYAKYISPHKLSLYAIASLPVICHKASAAAQVVKKYGIGIAVNALDELPQLIRDMKQEDYDRMRFNCMQVARGVSQGRRLKKALLELGIGEAPPDNE
ncbi:MAG TPA: hypothetical protein VFR58_10075 [Flavisolibacter sp.]|nr:hypothetical protein [Flavisolibacter sp.]